MDADLLLCNNFILFSGSVSRSWDTGEGVLTRSFILRRGLLLAFLFSLTLDFSATRAWGQIAQGNLVGTVNDSSGARIPSAQITVQSDASPLAARIVTADTSGEFSVPDLPPGR